MIGVERRLAVVSEESAEPADRSALPPPSILSNVTCPSDYSIPPHKEIALQEVITCGFSITCNSVLHRQLRAIINKVTRSLQSTYIICRPVC